MDRDLADRVRERVKHEVKRLIDKDWSLADATRAARVKVAFDVFDSVYWELEKVEDPDPYDDSYIDSVSEKREIARRIESDGVWGIRTSWRVSEDEEWEEADLCWGFIGDDWKDSGYDADLMLAAMRGFLHAAEKVLLGPEASKVEDIRAFKHAVELASFATRNDDEVKKADEQGILLLGPELTPTTPGAVKVLPHFYSRYTFRIRQNAYAGWDVLMFEVRPHSPTRDPEKMTSAIEPKSEALKVAASYAQDLAQRIPPNPNAIRVLDDQGACIYAVKSTAKGPVEVPCTLDIEFDRPWTQKRYFNPRANPMSRNTEAAIAIGVGTLGFGLLVWWLSRSAGAGYSETYRGYTFQVAYFSDWYNGTGWRFRFPAGDPSSGQTAWMGVAPSRDDAIASARYTVDLALGG